MASCAAGATGPGIVVGACFAIGTFIGGVYLALHADDLTYDDLATGGMLSLAFTHCDITQDERPSVI